MHGCPRTYKSFSSFRVHVYEIHGGSALFNNQPTPVACGHTSSEVVHANDVPLDQSREDSHHSPIKENEGNNENLKTKHGTTNSIM